NHLHFNRWIKRTWPARLEKIYETETKGADPRPSFEQWKADKGEKLLGEQEAKFRSTSGAQISFESEVTWRFLRPWHALSSLVSRWRPRLDTTALIGLAPFHSYSFEEEQKSAKAPLQIFAAAIRRLRLGLTDPTIASHLRFITVPDIVSVDSEDAARRWRTRL